ncbi:MAG TPA: BTAD domain-containing putative transcriptional regulator [Gemmatimonadales bacterium]|nr:BTAD domain-containing putative transcriptional regulator [Gemmatimonadales bacterium]
MGERGLTRDKIIGFLWPDADEERARRALTQALYALRQDLGSEEAFLGVKDLRLNPEIISADVVEFRAAMAAGALERAVELYRGPFLDGFHLPGAEEFERWSEQERQTLAREYGDLLEQLGQRATAAGDHRAAVGWFKKLAGMDPLNAKVAVALMRAHVAQGDQAAALQHAKVYEALLQQELDLPPDREVIAFAEELRRVARSDPELRRVAPPVPPVAAAPSEPTSPTEFLSQEVTGSRHTSGWAAISSSTGPEAPAKTRRTINVRKWYPALAAGAAVVLLGVGWLAGRRLIAPRGASEQSSSLVSSVAPTLVAVGRITDYTKPGGKPVAGLPLSDMLATNLARASGVQVVSSARMYELLRQLATGGDTAAVVVEAARKAGANELVDGALYQVGPDMLRLDLRRVDLGSGAVLQAYTVQGNDLFALADTGTRRLAQDLGASAPEGSLASVSTRSVAAYRYYEEGLRTYFASNLPQAEQLFAKALKEDSAFAMAQFYYANSNSGGTRTEYFRRLRRAVSLSAGASDRERLLIGASWALANSSPALRAIAETLTVRYPSELEGYLYTGQGALLALDWAGAREPLHQVIARDSLGLVGRSPRCMACEGLVALSESYLMSDSIAGALRVARLWTRLQPGSAQAWRYYANVLAQRGWADSSLAALHVADSLGSDGFQSAHTLMAIRLFTGAYGEAEQIMRVELQSGPPKTRLEAGWQLANVLRQEGRYTEALDLAGRYRRDLAEPTPPGSAPTSAYLEAQVLFDRGQYQASAALFDSIAKSTSGFEDPSALARNRVWAWTHMADALAAMGDTIQLSALADSVRTLAEASGFARDARLHYHIRGLLLASRGFSYEAAQAFEKAMTSVSDGFSRTNYELAAIWLRLKRPKDAIPILQAAIRGSFEGGNLYVTRTELHERLAEAWEAAGRKDSAEVHYREVMRAWEKADSLLIPRRAGAARALTRLTASR